MMMVKVVFVFSVMVWLVGCEVIDGVEGILLMMRVVVVFVIELVELEMVMV